MLTMELCRWMLLPCAIYALVLFFSSRGESRGTRSLLLAAFAIVGSYVLLTSVASQIQPRPSKAFVARVQ